MLHQTVTVIAQGRGIAFDRFGLDNFLVELGKLSLRPLISAAIALRCSCNASTWALRLLLKLLNRWARLPASAATCWRKAMELGVALASLSAAKNWSKPILMLEPSPDISASIAVR